MHSELTGLRTRKHLIRPNVRVWAECACTLLLTGAHRRGRRGGSWQCYVATEDAICICQEGRLLCLGRSGPVRAISAHVGSKPTITERATRLPIPVALKATFCCPFAMQSELTCLHARKHLIRPNVRVWADCACTLRLTDSQPFRWLLSDDALVDFLCSVTIFLDMNFGRFL